MQSIIMRKICAILLLALLTVARAGAARSEIVIDFSRTNGTFRALHGINKGPITAGGLSDLTEPLRELGIPFIRLHDCHWPNPDVVDMHAVFPRFEAAAERPKSYDFALTDEYLHAAKRTGAQLIYRLGESIEHTSVKRFVHPPADMEKWAEISAGIIRHYNDGWADGPRLGIQYWEVWNEPDNRPAMWSGSDEDYFRLYRVTARRIKKEWPKLKVGGPGLGSTGRFVHGVFQSTSFVTNFLALCARESLPLDFFSWHCYTDDPQELVLRARAIRSLLDQAGFKQTESHLNEWNFLPGNSWAPLMRNAAPKVRERYYSEMSGAAGGAFLVTALLRLQDAPIDVCNLFHGEAGPFGLFNEHGVPQKSYHALQAFAALLSTRQKIMTWSATGRITVAAGVNRDSTVVTVLGSQMGNSTTPYDLRLTNLPWKAETRLETRLVDGTHDYELVNLATNRLNSFLVPLRLRGPAVQSIRLSPVLVR